MIRFPIRVRMWVLLVFLVSLLVGCSDPNTSYIQGRWAAGNVHFWSEWYFDRGYFEYFSTITVHGSMAENSGSYRILASEGDTLTLELYNTGPGDPLEETTQLAITINRDDGSLSINRAAYYPVTGHDLDEVTISPTP